jgi:uncharacterized protein (DUF1778 family)
LKTRRIEARLNEADDELIDRAAELVGESRSQFVVRAAADRAARLVARCDVTLIPEDDFDALLGSLDEAGPALAKLATAAARPRPYARR